MIAADKYTAAIFDMDGLLLDTEQIINDCLKETAVDFALDDLEPVFLSMIGLRINESRAVLREGIAERVSFDDFYSQAYERVQTRLAEPIPVKRTVVAVLERLRNDGVPCAVASSTRSELVTRQLADAGLDGFFQSMIGGDQVKHAKPHPEIYLRSAQALQADPSQCVAFEDSPHGTRAALASGATTVQVPDMIDAYTGAGSERLIVADTLWDGAVAAALIAA